ncbi:hypothetical protein [Deinococcus radiophilus]|uniref:hypothetical protein n=1 Tax=Deinococcus radiophilus TaxID=32062 RepID=UPI00361E02DF
MNPTLPAAYAHLGRDPVMAGLIARYGDLPSLEVAPDPFARLIRSVVGQQLSVKAARSIYGRLEAALGEVTAPALLATTPDELRAWACRGPKCVRCRTLPAPLPRIRWTLLRWLGSRRA